MGAAVAGAVLRMTGRSRLGIGLMVVGAAVALCAGLLIFLAASSNV
jgi:hypothetical protein